jgi:tellurite resistance protein TerC
LQERKVTGEGVSEILGVTYRWARRCAIALVGGTVVLIGIAMIALPGPAVVVIPAGLAILALEFAWAKVWLKKVQDTGGQFKDSVWAWCRRRNRPLK